VDEGTPFPCRPGFISAASKLENCPKQPVRDNLTICPPYVHEILFSRRSAFPLALPVIFFSCCVKVPKGSEHRLWLFRPVPHGDVAYFPSSWSWSCSGSNISICYRSPFLLTSVFVERASASFQFTTYSIRLHRIPWDSVPPPSPHLSFCFLRQSSHRASKPTLFAECYHPFNMSLDLF